MNTGHNLRIALGVAVAWSWCVVVSAFAEENISTQPPAPAPVTRPAPLPPSDLTRFENFLDLHPGIEARLRENPDIVNNPAFQKNHPVFAQYLARHPEIGTTLATKPRWLIHRELIRQSATPVTPAQVAEFDRFLDQHPRMEKLLAQHPQLLRHPDFHKNYPELHEYMKRHPGINRSDELKSGGFRKRERLN